MLSGYWCTLVKQGLRPALNCLGGYYWILNPFLRQCFPGYALAIHGHPRYTKDIDIWVWIDPINAKNIVQTLRDFGFSELDLQENDFLMPGNVIQLGYPPNRIDILTQATGVNFQACFLQKVQVEIDGVKINFIDIDNLIKNKKAVGRLQDLADIEKLQ